MATGQLPTTAHAIRRWPARAWGRAVGKAAELRLPPPVVRAAVAFYGSALGVQMDEAAIPASGYRTFGDFFARRLRSGARRVDRTEGGLVCPCDGVVTAAGALEPGAAAMTFEVKGRRYAASELVGRPLEWLERASPAWYAVVYLSPADYHRVHSPADGVLRRVWRISGTRAPVNELGARIAPAAVVTNERAMFEVDGEGGPLVLAMVGALAVSSIEVTVPGFVAAGEGHVAVWRGDELGAFRLGSTVVVLWSGDAVPRVRPGQRVAMGQRLAANRS